MSLIRRRKGHDISEVKEVVRGLSFNLKISSSFELITVAPNDLNPVIYICIDFVLQLLSRRILKYSVQ